MKISSKCRVQKFVFTDVLLVKSYIPILFVFFFFFFFFFLKMGHSFNQSKRNSILIIANGGKSSIKYISSEIVLVCCAST